MAAAVNINIPNAKGRTQLIRAVLNNNINKVKKLIAAGADVNKGRTDNGATPLLIASELGDLELVKVLIAGGADVNKGRTDFGVTPLFIASEFGHLELVKVLIAGGADINKARTDIGVTPLFIASEVGHIEVVKTLLAAGADINKARTDIKATPLFIASYNGHLEVVKTLLAAGADVNKSRTDNGTSSLYTASEEGHIEVVKTLLAAGADINKARTDIGATPLFIASEKGHLEIVKILLEEGADINIPSFIGKSVLQYAEEGAFIPEINELILNKGGKLQEVAFNQNNINKPNTNVFDVFMAMNSPFNNVYGDQDNIVFKVGNSFFAYPRDQIQNELDDKSGIRYICNKELHGTPLIKDVDIKNPYYLLKGPGMYMIPVTHIKKAIEKKEDRFYELVDSGEVHPFTASYTSVGVEGQYDNLGYILNQSGNRVDIVSADHCQAGSERKVYKLKKLNIKAAPEGGRRRLRRKTKKAKKARKNKSRKH